VAIEDGQGVIFCNECGEVIEAMVPIEELDAALSELGSTDEACSETCPRCGSVNTFSGFSVMRAYICRWRGVSVETTVQ
jgi:transcription elongation factor Elf1